MRARSVLQAFAHTAYIALGANLEDPVRQVLTAACELGRLPETRLIARSSLYRTRPVGYTEQPDFINAVARVETALAARILLRELLALEERRGRVRSVRNGPRTLDLDLLLYDEEIIAQEGLMLPHPRMHERAFVLVPLAELASAISIPGCGAIGDLLRTLDTRDVERIEHA